MDKRFARRIVGGTPAFVGILGIGVAGYFGFSSLTLTNDENPNIQKATQAQETLEKNLRESNEQLNTELKEIEAQYELPPNATFVSDYSFKEINDQLQQVEAQTMQRSTEDAEFEVEKVWYEPGYFKSDALVQWQCAWLREAVIAQEADDETRLNQALTQLDSLKQKPEIEMFPDYETFLNDNVSPIKEGNTQPARDFINSGHTCVDQNQIK